MAQKENLSIDQGVTYKHRFDYVDTTNTPIDISGYTARMQIRESVDDTVTVYDSTVGSDIEIDGPNGTVTLTIPATTTEAFTFSAGVYDIEIVSSQSEVIRLVEGRVKIRPEVTR